MICNIMEKKGLVNKENRDYGIDLLKVVSMWMIVASHILQQGLSFSTSTPFSIKWYMSNFLMALLICHVNIYALISGYVKAGHNNRLKKALHLWLIVFFYSLVSYLCQVFSGKDYLCVRGVLKCVLLFISGRYWYFTAYCGLLLIAPFLTKIIDDLDVMSARRLLFGALFFWGVCGWIGGLFSTGSIIGSYNGFSTVWLAIMYCVGYSIRKFGNKIVFLSTKTGNIFSYFFSAILLFASSVILMHVGGGGISNCL